MLIFSPVIAAQAVTPTAFFFDAFATAIDIDSDGLDDAIMVRFDIDLDQEGVAQGEVAAQVEVAAELYNISDQLVAIEETSVRVSGQQAGYDQLTLTPSPNAPGIYYVYLQLDGGTDALYLDGIDYAPFAEDTVAAYFAEVAVEVNEVDLRVSYDLDLVQDSPFSVSVEAILVDSLGETVDRTTTTIETAGQFADPHTLALVPPEADLYTLFLWASVDATLSDTYARPVLWPPGEGIFFRDYEAEANVDGIKVTFEVDVAYEVSYPIFVEGILYDAEGDVAAYSATYVVIEGIADDNARLLLVPETDRAGTYYVELVAYTDRSPAARGFIDTILYTPPGSAPAWDVNRDGIVDIVDLIFVGRNFGSLSPEPGADINGDGVVDIQDLILVGQHFGEGESAALGAPPGLPSLLLPNYPNPFNPDTWIPFALSQDAETEIRIFDLVGRLVRKLRLGYLRAGLYLDPAHAAHWNGKNDVGEAVASGLYVYQLRAGRFIAVRRMLLVR